MSSNRSIQLWSARARILSRVWACDHCGAKVYCGRLATKPVYRCLCGKVAWHQVEKYSSRQD
jgi:hypothetical protein